MDQTIIALQETLAHQEEVVRQLSDELYAQQREIVALKRQMAQIVGQVKTLSDQQEGAVGREPPPPHY